MNEGTWTTYSLQGFCFCFSLSLKQDNKNCVTPVSPLGGQSNFTEMSVE